MMCLTMYRLVQVTCTGFHFSKSKPGIIDNLQSRYLNLRDLNLWVKSMSRPGLPAIKPEPMFSLNFKSECWVPGGPKEKDAPQRGKRPEKTALFPGCSSTLQRRRGALNTP